jgi:ABC-2 type transport system ATP-binding protein
VTEPIVRIEHLRKEFAYTSPTPNASTDDMWLDYLLGLLGRRSGELAAQRKRTVAVDDVSLEVSEGEFFGLLGPNGAGKTTLIKMLATILRPNSGSIAINGHDTVRETTQARACINVVAASGWFAFDMQLTLTQNLVFWGRLCGLDRATATARAHEALDIVDLGEWRNGTPNTLSSGMRQRLALAKGLLVRTPVFLLDEPTANVDPLIGYQIRDFLRNSLNRELGQTIVIATHNMAEAAHLCDRVAIVSEGRLLACDRPERLTRKVEGRIVDVALPRDAARTLARLRTTGLAIQVADTIDEHDTGTLRLHLAAGASIASLRGHLPEATPMTTATPTLEDVFVHYTGRKLDGNDDTRTAA